MSEPAGRELVMLEVPESWVRIARERMEALPGKSPKRHFATIVQQLMEEAAANVALTPPIPVSPTNIEDACRMIVSCLDPEHRDLIHQLAKDTQRPVTSFIMSAILRAREQGAVADTLGPWTDATVAALESPPPDQSECQYCHRYFVPVTKGQQFCPPPADGSDSCGRKHLVAQMRATRPQEVQLPRNPDLTPPMPKQYPRVPRAMIGR